MYFNTSHVSINQRNASGKSVMSCDFNTSHVSINPNVQTAAIFGVQFQYISCFY